MNSIRTLGMDHFGKEGYLYPNQSKIVKGRDTRNSIVIIRLILGKTPLYIIYMLFCCSRCRLETCYKGRQKPSTLGRANHASDNGIPSFLIMSENDGAGGRRETRFRYSARISIRRWIGPFFTYLCLPRLNLRPWITQLNNVWWLWIGIVVGTCPQGRKRRPPTSHLLMSQQSPFVGNMG